MKVISMAEWVALLERIEKLISAGIDDRYGRTHVSLAPDGVTLWIRNRKAPYVLSIGVYVSGAKTLPSATYFAPDEEQVHGRGVGPLNVIGGLSDDLFDAARAYAEVASIIRGLKINAVWPDEIKE